MKILNNTVLALLFLALISCARVGAPDGGEKDTTSPELIKAKPANNSVLFVGKEIVLTFNEFVKLNDLSKQLIVSPAMPFEPEIAVKNKSILIKLKGELEANTTYNINFGDAIVDVNEGNVFSNFSYVFSTGTYIDTLSIRGNIQQAFSLKGAGGLRVMLYKGLDDSLPLKSKPNYLTKTDAAGNFELRNLKSDTFKLFALVDKNSNFLWENNEELAFLDSAISLNTSLDSLALKSFITLPEKILVLSKKQEENRKITLVLNAPCTSCVILKNTLVNSISRNSNSDTITLWLNEPWPSDSLNLFLKQANEMPIDTLSFFARKSDKKKLTVSLAIELEGGKTQYIGQTVKLKSKVPLKQAYVKVPFVLNDTNTVEVTISSDSTNAQSLSVDLAHAFGLTGSLILKDSLFESIYGNFSSADSIVLFMPEAEYYGNLKFNINNLLNEQLIFTMLGEKTKQTLTRTLSKGSQELSFDKLQPDMYSLKIIVDKNKNGIWDTGDYFKKQQPEKVINYKEAVNIRSNWDLELDWAISE